MNRRQYLIGTAGVAGLAGCTAMDENCPVPTASGNPTEWPHRHHDLGNSNAVPSGPESLSERWSVRIEARLARPVVADGSVYTLIIPFDRQRDTRLVAYDLDTGDRQWTTAMPESDGGQLAAAINGRIYVVADASDTARRAQRLYVLTDGSVAWTFDAESITSVAAANQVSFVSVRHGSIVGLDATDGQVCGRLHPAEWLGGRWLSDLTPVGRPALLDGSVFAPVARYDSEQRDSYGEDRIVAFDPIGGIRWESAVFDSTFLSDVAAVDETVYVPATKRSGQSEERRRASLHALEAASGKQRWERSLETGGISGTAVREDVIIVAGSGVAAYEPTSDDRRWRNPTLFGPPVLAGSYVYGRETVGEFVDTVVAVDVGTGTPEVSHTFDYQLNRPPVVANGRAIARTVEYDDAGHVASRLHALW